MPRNSQPPRPRSTLDKVADGLSQQSLHTTEQQNDRTIEQHSNGATNQPSNEPTRQSTYTLPVRTFDKLNTMVNASRPQFQRRRVTDAQIIAIAVDRLYATFQQNNSTTFSEAEFKPKPGPRLKEKPQPTDFQNFE